MIDFSAIEETKMLGMKGGAGPVSTWIDNDGMVKIMKSVLPRGSSIGYHKHETNCEVVYVISGVASCTLDGVEETVQAGEVHYCPRGHSHGVVNKGQADLVVLCVVPEIK
jgi:quercetin dioxygenase-like cupin family protein